MPQNAGPIVAICSPLNAGGRRKPPNIKLLRLGPSKVPISGAFPDDHAAKRHSIVGHIRRHGAHELPSKLESA